MIIWTNIHHRPRSTTHYQ